MRLKKLILSIVIISVTLMLISTLGFTNGFSDKGCMDVIVGKDASVDGSVMTSHTVDGWYDSNIHVVPGQTFKKGAMVDVFWNIIGELIEPPSKIGEIPQVEKTYTYFHTAYSHMNEHQLMIGETTIGQKEELSTFLGEKAIMTIEQLQVFALQRAKTAREAIKVMGSLAEKYGFLPSCDGEAECLTIADPKEAWVFEVFSVGIGWDPKSGKPGAIWAAQRVPDDEIVCVPNISRIREIGLGKPDYFMASDNYMQVAIDFGWYDPASGKPFIWQEAYSPLLGGWSLSSEWIRIRLHLVYSTAAPSMEWDPYKETQTYPFSIKPEKKMSVKNLMDLQRSTLTGTVFDMEANSAWLVPGSEGKCVKSPFATPFPVKDMRKLLNIPYHRPAAKYNSSYGIVSQSREWLPDTIGGVLWFYLDNPHMACYVPIYAGVQDIIPSWKTFDRNEFSLDSARWAFALADDLVNRRYQDAIKDLRAVCDPLQAEFLTLQPSIEIAALELHKKDPDLAKKFLTDYTKSCMKKAEKAYWDLNWDLIQKYNNNKGLTP